MMDSKEILKKTIHYQLQNNNCWVYQMPFDS